MKKHLKKFNYLKWLINVVYYVVLVLIGANFGIILAKLDIELSSISLVLIMGGYAFVYYVLYFISILWHELGHFVFGLKAKLKFISFNVLSFEITKNNGKLSLKKQPKIPGGILGYCNMSFDENEEYSEKDICLYFMGGIIFNVILTVIFLILFLIIDNKIIDNIFILAMALNLYMALHNSIPANTKTGLITDMFHLINCYNDVEYIKTFGIFYKIQNLLVKGIQLKDMDENLFYKPANILSNSDIKMAMIYIDYISEKEKYEEAIEYIKLVLEDENNVLLKTDSNLLKIQLLNCLFYGNYDLDLILDYWDKDTQKYLDAMCNLQPLFLGFNYMFALLVKKDEIKANKCLKQFEEIKKKYPDKMFIEEAEKLIKDVNLRINN